MTAYDGHPETAGSATTRLIGRLAEFSIVGFQEALVTRRIYPDDPLSMSKAVVEYMVRTLTDGQFMHAICLQPAFGAKNGSETVLHPASQPDGTVADQFTPASASDGDLVVVAALHGVRRRGIIIGAYPRAQAASYAAKKDDGERYVSTFAGSTVEIRQDGSVTVTVKAGQSVQVRTDGPDSVFLGGSDPTDYAALAGRTDTDLGFLVDKINAIIAYVLAATVPPLTPPPPAPMSSLPSVASTVVRVA